MKIAKSIEEQLEILKSRRIIITDEEKAKQILQDINYYTLTGYMFQFKRNENYQEDISFDLIYNLYLFDNELKTLLLAQVLKIEEKIKTRIAYYIAMQHTDNSLIYLEETYFRDKDEFKAFKNNFDTLVRNNATIPFVKHHIDNYGGKFPIWVAIELLTLGNIKYLYKNIPSKERKIISTSFNISPKVLDSWIDMLRILRNRLAHNIRLYNSTFKAIPRFEKHHKVYTASNRIYIFLLLLKHLSHSKDDWENTIYKLEELLDEYSKYVKNECLGLPDNWIAELKYYP